MSKKFKKLLCGFLAVAMLSSCGVVAMADEQPATTNAATEATATPAAEATATPEAAEPSDTTTEATEAPATEAPATEAPTATAEPTAEPTEAPVIDEYESDSYYQKALSLCSALGIITGYEDGSVKPETTVTRAEMAAIVLRVLHTETVAYRNLYTDVDASHWAADTIEAATEKKIVDGMGDGTFVPDGDVLTEQVLKMLVCAMNYNDDAEANGGWPTGYTRVAQQNLKLTKSVNSMLGSAAKRGEVIKMVYNALIGPYKELSGNDKNGNPTYTSEHTLAYAMYDIVEGVGIVTATSKKAISGNTTSEGQIKIEGEIYDSTVANVDEFVGKKVTFYYTHNDRTDDNVIAMYSDSSKTETVVIDAKDIDSITGIAATSENGQIKTLDKKTNKNKNTYKTAAGLQVLYNGTVITPDIYSAAMVNEPRFKNYVLNGDKVVENGTKEYIDFITPENGTITLIDYDTDGKYDIMDVKSYETMLVSSATDDKVMGTIAKTSVTINTENERGDKTITITKDGSTVKPKNLKKNDVAAIARNLDNTIIEAIVTGESVTGVIEAVSTDEDDNKVVTIAGTEYVVDYNAVADCTSGSEGTFYTDVFGRIGYVAGSSSGKTSGDEKYACLINTYVNTDDGSNDVMIKLFTQEGKTETYKMSSSMSYWPAGAIDKHTATKDEIIALSGTSGFVKTNVGGKSVPIKLAKYKVNSKNEITQLYLASGKTDSNVDSKGVIVDTTNMRSKGAAGNFIGGYMLEDGGVQFNVPAAESDMKDAANYSVASITASQYLNVEGVGVDFVLGEFKDSRYPKVLIRFSTSGGTTVSPISDYGTANDNPTMLISSIGYGKDEDDNTIFTIKGYSGGAMVSYTTCNTTGVYTTGANSPMQDKETYSGGDKAIYDATKDGEDEFYDALKPGDIIGIQASGSTANVIIKIVDAENVVADEFAGTATQWKGNASFSSTRDNVTFGKINAAQLEGSAFMTVDSISVAFDGAKVLDDVVIKVDSDGNILSTKVDKEGGLDISDVEAALTDDSIIDYAFVRQFKGGMREISIIRIEIQ